MITTTSAVSRQELASKLFDLLAASPGQTARELAGRLHRHGIDVDKSTANSVLYSNRRLFRVDASQAPPRWHLKDRRPVTPAPTRTTTSTPPRYAAPSTLYAWQADALDAWRRQGSRGVVEAVTGTGKTRVGLVAVEECLWAGGNALILVPTVDLQRQWREQVERHIPNAEVGQLGGGHSAAFAGHDVVIAVVNSARSYDLGRLRANSLLVGDECHRYGSAVNGEALDSRFHRRLGLTATFERNDDGIDDVLRPYFGNTCYAIGYDEAIADEVTAHFKVAMVGVPFAPGDRRRYEDADEKANKAQRWLVTTGCAPAEPFGEFMHAVSLLAKGDAGKATYKARSFLAGFSERKRILAETSTKRERLAQLVPAFEAADRSIVFTQTVEAAEDAADWLQHGGIDAQAIHSKQRRDERNDLLAAFGAGEVPALCAPQVLDEGVDVPAADFAVILGASRTKRQMIQRMGRVLRRKTDDRLARFVVLYVEGSSEDPDHGAHGDFLDAITDAAEDVTRFPVGASPDEITRYLNDMQSSHRIGRPRLAEDGRR